MKVTLDYSPSSTIVLCACTWRELQATRRAALLAAVDHNEAVHPDDTRDIQKLRQRVASLKTRGAA